MKLCKDCKWAGAIMMFYECYYDCHCPKLGMEPISPVDGSGGEQREEFCVDVRRRKIECGPDGLWWEPKPPAKPKKSILSKLWKFIVAIGGCPGVKE